MARDDETGPGTSASCPVLDPSSPLPRAPLPQLPAPAALGDPSPSRARAQRIAVAATIFMLGASTSFAGLGYLAGRLELAEREQRIALLERDAANARRQRQSIETRLLRTIGDLEATADHQRETIRRLGDLESSVQQDLDLTRRELAATLLERDAAQELAANLGKGAADQESLRRSADKERQALVAKLASLEAKLGTLSAERESARANEQRLIAEVQAGQARLTAAAKARQEAEQRLAAAGSTPGAAAAGEAGKDEQAVAALTEEERPAPRSARAGSRSQIVEAALAKAGVNLGRLLDRVGDQIGSGVGGPLETEAQVEGGAAGIELASAEDGQEIVAASLRERQIERLIQLLPLDPPVAGSYKLMSRFGSRRDPITGRRAYHSGLDFSAGLDTPIHPAVGGKVVSARREGDYGLMVVVDHGLGISTAYAHMKKILVKPGQKVTRGSSLGIMGSTGRSTGRHVHYEVRVDGKAVDPAPFVEAGKQLAHVRKG